MADRWNVNVRVFPEAINQIARGPEVHEFIRGIAEDAAAEIRQGAPVRTGAGRASIRSRVEMGTDGWIGTASWDVAHYYMGIQNSRRPFVEPAMSRVRYV